jgi:hypothetical protein
LDRVSLSLVDESSPLGQDSFTTSEELPSLSGGSFLMTLVRTLRSFSPNTVEKSKDS